MRIRPGVGWVLLVLCCGGDAAAQRLRALSSPSRFAVPAHRRDGAAMARVVRRYFALLAPHLVEVVKECPRTGNLVRLQAKDSPYVALSRNHAGPHWMRREVRDRLIFAAAFARAKGGYQIAVGIARRTFRAQADLWHWRLVERVGAPA